MLRQLSYYIFSVFVILTFSNTNILLVNACFSTEISCSTSYPYYITWCCPRSDSCGTSYGSCDSGSSNIPIYILIPVVVFIGICMITVCGLICRQCNSSTLVNRPIQPARRYGHRVPTQQARYVQQQHPVQRTPVVTYVNPSAYTHTAAPIHNIREDLPPSYDAITRDTRYNSPVPSQEPSYSSYQGVNLRV